MVFTMTEKEERLKNQISNFKNKHCQNLRVLTTGLNLFVQREDMTECMTNVLNSLNNIFSLIDSLQFECWSKPIKIKWSKPGDIAIIYEYSTEFDKNSPFYLNKRILVLELFKFSTILNEEVSKIKKEKGDEDHGVISDIAIDFEKIIEDYLE